MVLATSAARSSFFFSMPSPTWYRVNRRMEMFSPILATASVTTSWTFFLSSFTKGWSTRHTVSKYFSIFPVRIFSIIASGFFCSRSLTRSISFSLSSSSTGISSRRTNWGLSAAMWRARSRTRVWKSSFRATKSVSQFTSTRTPTLPLWT